MTAEESTAMSRFTSPTEIRPIARNDVDAPVSRSAGSIKRLGWVVYLATTYINFLVWLFFLPYNTARQFTPSFLEQYVEQIEHTAHSLVQPVVTKAADLSYSVLGWVDDKVDEVVLWLEKFHEENKQHFNVAQEAYLQLIEDTATNISDNGVFGVLKS